MIGVARFSGEIHRTLGAKVATDLAAGGLIALSAFALGAPLPSLVALAALGAVIAATHAAALRRLEARVAVPAAATERRLIAALDAVPDGLAILDGDDRIVHFNRHYPDHLAEPLRRTLATGKRFRDWIVEGLAIGPVYHPDMGAEFVERRLEMHRAAPSDHVHRLIDDRHVRIREIATADGGRVLLSSDVTAEEAREGARALLALAVENVGDAVEITDRQDRFTYVNRAFEEMTGWRREDVLGRTPEAVLRSGSHPPAFFEAMAAELAAGRTWQGTIINRMRDGELLDQETTISPLRDSDGVIRHYVAVKRNVTEARAALRALEQSEARYRAVVDTQAEFILRVAPDRHWTFMNEASRRYAGMTGTDVAKFTDMDVIHPEDLPIYEAHMARITPENPTDTAVWRSHYPGKGVHWEEWTDTGIFDAEGRLTEYQCIGRQVDDRVAAERAHAEAEELRRTALEAALDCYVGTDARGLVIEWNPAAERTFGYSRDAALGRQLAELIVPADRRAAHAAGFARHLATGESRILGRRLEVEAIRADGAAIPVELVVVRGNRAEGPVFLAYMRDLSESRRAEQALKASDARLKAFMEFAPVAAHLRDRDGRYLMINREMENILGVSADQAIGQRPTDIVSSKVAGSSDEYHAQVVASGALQVTEQHLAHLTEGPYRWTMVIRFPVLDADGEVSAVGTFAVDITERKEAEAALKASEQRLAEIIAANPVAMNITRISDRRLLFANRPYVEMFGLESADPEAYDRAALYRDPGDRDRIFDEVAAGRDVTAFDVTLRRADGRDVPASITARPLVFQGELAVVSSKVDLTALRTAQAEIARQREALWQSEKLNALGSLLAGVSHELNNPLSVVVGFSSMLLEFTPDGPTRDRIEKIAAAADRCARIVRTFLAMARSRPPVRRPVDLSRIAGAAIELAIFAGRKSGIEIVTDLANGLPPVDGDADQLHQVVTNLVVNALQALDGRAKGRVEIETRAEDGSVRLIVRDNGPGIPPDLITRVFEPFFSTKPQGFGTGVGLSVCRGIVEAHGGVIAAENAAASGAVFTVRLPAATGKVADDPCPEDVRGRGRVLIVDDEPDIAALLAERLRLSGFSAETAAGGTEALARLAEGGFDAVITDLRMPGVDGSTLLWRIEKEHSELAGRVLCITGDILGMATPLPDGVPVFEKPLDLGLLMAELVRRVGPAEETAA